MHWLTIITALSYAAVLFFLVLVKGWDLVQAATMMIGLGIGVVLVIIAAVMMIHKGDRRSFWDGMAASLGSELRGMLKLIRFK